MRAAWRQGHFTPLASRSTLDELIRVLGYPKFRLDAGEVLALLEDYVPFSETVPQGPPAGAVPRAPDPDDQKFLDLAVAGRASFLVTGDAALRAVAPPPGLEIVTPQAFHTRIYAGGA
jgi:putative PIN family toxin of toxin-antitoxin system